MRLHVWREETEGEQVLAVAVARASIGFRGQGLAACWLRSGQSPEQSRKDFTGAWHGWSSFSLS